MFAPLPLLGPTAWAVTVTGLLGSLLLGAVACGEGRPSMSSRPSPAAGSSHGARSALPGASLPAPPPSSPASEPLPDAASTTSALAPLRHPSAMLELAVAGHAPAVVSLPLGATTPRPVLFATHGNYDRPQWQCAEWREVVGNRAFVLCPRGVARADSPSQDDIRFTYGDNQALERELGAALTALQERFAGYVDAGPILYTGFSLGAIMGVAIAARAPQRHPVLVLVEGGTDWTWQRAKAFAAGGGRRVLFACSQRGCTAAARQAASKLEAVKVATKVVEVAGLGHSYGGPLNEPIREALPWLLAGDERWAPLAP